MLLQAAVVIELAAGFDDIKAMQQPVVAARAAQRLIQWLARVITMFMEQTEQADDAARCDLQALVFIKPDALAGKAQVENDFTAERPLEAVLGHRLPAGRTSRRLHCALDRADGPEVEGDALFHLADDVHFTGLAVEFED